MFNVQCSDTHTGAGTVHATSRQVLGGLICAQVHCAALSISRHIALPPCTSVPTSRHTLAGKAPCKLALASHACLAPRIVSHEENHVCVFMGHAVFGRVLALCCVP